MTPAEYIRNHYGVPAKKGMRVTADGKPGVITGYTGASIRIRLDGEKHSAPWHPTWRMEYHAASTTSGSGK